MKYTVYAAEPHSECMRVVDTFDTWRAAFEFSRTCMRWSTNVEIIEEPSTPR